MSFFPPVKYESQTRASNIHRSMLMVFRLTIDRCLVHPQAKSFTMCAKIYAYVEKEHLFTLLRSQKWQKEKVKLLQIKNHLVRFLAHKVNAFAVVVFVFVFSLSFLFCLLFQRFYAAMASAIA